jgi:hypothetical protein
VVSFTPRSLYPQGKSPWYRFDRRLGGEEACVMTQKKMVWLGTERHQKGKSSWKAVKDCGEKEEI